MGGGVLTHPLQVDNFYTIRRSGDGFVRSGMNDVDALGSRIRAISVLIPPSRGTAFKEAQLAINRLQEFL